MLDGYRQLVAALIHEGEPPVSRYWIDGAAEFYAGTAYERIENAGRGGDKTRNLVRCAIVETLFGQHTIPASERHYFAIVSENVTEATKTLRLVESYLRILHVPFTATADTIELGTMNRGIKVLACRVGAVSGFRCFGWAADEVAKWRDADGANPCREVVASIRAMTVTHPTARGRMYSSPLGVAGYFYESFLEGSDERVMVRGPTPSWGSERQHHRGADALIGTEPEGLGERVRGARRRATRRSSASTPSTAPCLATCPSRTRVSSRRCASTPAAAATSGPTPSPHGGPSPTPLPMTRACSSCRRSGPFRSRTTRTAPSDSWRASPIVAA